MGIFHLLLERESSTVIGVEELQEAVALVLADSEAALISKETLDLAGAHSATGIAVKSLEGRVWSKITDLAKSLAGCF